MNVFLVDDALPIRERLKLTVEESGACVVGEAATEADAMLGLRESRADLAVVDLRLEEGNGFGVLYHLKQTHPETVVVVMTNYSQPIYRRMCMQMGADYFFNKTSEFSRFEALMASLAAEAGGVDTQGA